MGKSFEKFRKKHLIYAIIKSALTGISAGLFVSGLVLLVLKLTGTDLHTGYYALIGAGVALVCGGLCFLFLRPTAKKSAKLLDEDYSLGEKVQTMVEFSGREGVLLDLQREDASARLASAPAKRRSFSEIWQYFLIPLVAAALFFTGIFVPAKTVHAGPDDDFEITPWQISALEQLITEVGGSDLSDGIKTPAVEQLEGLLGILKETETASGMHGQVGSAVSAIDAAVESECSFLDLSAAFADSDAIGVFATAVTRSATVYSGSVKTFLSFTQVTDIAKRMDDGIDTYLNKAVNSVNSVLSPEESEDRLVGTALVNAIKVYTEPLDEALASSGVGETDALRQSLAGYADGLEAVSEQVAVGGASKDTLADMVRTAGTDFISSATIALHAQAYNQMLDDYIRDRLCYIFSLSEADLPERREGTLGSDADDENGDSDDDENTNGGGGGNSELILGSDDAIFYYKTGEHVRYADVFTEYENRKAIVTDEDSVSEEFKKYLDNYFKILSGGLNN